jgi:hypothetical protein
MSGWGRPVLKPLAENIPVGLFGSRVSRSGMYSKKKSGELVGAGDCDPGHGLSCS